MANANPIRGRLGAVYAPTTTTNAAGLSVASTPNSTIRWVISDEATRVARAFDEYAATNSIDVRDSLNARIEVESINAQMIELDSSDVAASTGPWSMTTSNAALWILAERAIFSNWELTVSQDSLEWIQLGDKQHRQKSGLRRWTASGDLIWDDQSGVVAGTTRPTFGADAAAIVLFVNDTSGTVERFVGWANIGDSSVTVDAEQIVNGRISWAGQGHLDYRDATI